MDKEFVINKVIEDNKAIITVEGWLDVQTSPKLGEVIDEIDDTITDVILDFGKVEYISSAGIRQIVAIHKKMATKGVVKIANVTPVVMDILQMTGLDKRLNII